MKCPNCGNTIDENILVCHYCGEDLEVSSTRIISSSPDTREVSPSEMQKNFPPTREISPSNSQATQLYEYGHQSLPKKLYMQIYPPRQNGNSFLTIEDHTIIGRQGDIQIEDGFMSAQHVEIILDNGTFYLVDLNSTNGVFLKLVDEVRLHKEIEILMGKHQFFVHEISEEDFVPVIDQKTQVLEYGKDQIKAKTLYLTTRMEGVSGEKIYKIQEEVIIGRDQGHIRTGDIRMSGQHAKISLKNDHFYLSDLKSSNGTFIRVRKQLLLEKGMIVLMGKHLFLIDDIK